MQTMHVLQDGAETMMWAVSKLLKDGNNWVLMPGDISNADGSVDRFAVLRAVEGHVPSLAPLRVSQFLRGGTQAFIQERDTD